MIKNNPIFKLLLPFLAGILLSLHTPIGSIPYKYIIFSFIFVIYMVLATMTPSTKRNKTLNMLLLLIFLSLGMARTDRTQTEPATYSEPVAMLSQLTDYPDSTDKSIKLKINIQQVYEDSIWKNIKSGAIVYLPKDADSRKLRAGDYIYTYAKPDAIKNMGNPGEFDFKSWSNANGIYYQFYVPAEYWQKSEQIEALPFTIILKRLRKSIFEYYKASGIKDAELAVFTALTLGDKSMLDSELRQGYASAGLMHILAVSGLHVGLVYAVILGLFKPFAKRKAGKITRFCVSIVVLWGYAMLTGLSPSVTRAATMFTVFIAGDLFGRKYAVYNSMALAAFLLLFNEPQIIDNVGFQMSFLAVFGIVAMFPYISKWLFFKYKFLNAIWQIMAVSIAAQAITTPLSLFYFNQFPTLFLISNVLMIPLATGLMYVFVVFIIVAPIPILASYVAKLIGWGVYLMNAFTNQVNAIEWATVKGLSIDAFQTVLLYAILAASVLWGLKTNFKNLRLLTILIASLLLSAIYQQYKTDNTNTCIVFNTYGEPLLFASAGKSYNFWNPEQTDETRYINNTVTKNNLKPNFSGFSTLKDQINLFGNEDRRGIYYNVSHISKSDTATCRWLILSEKSPYNLNELLKQIRPQTIIADASVSPSMLKKWKEQIEHRNVAIYDINQKGAFIEKW